MDVKIETGWKEILQQSLTNPILKILYIYKNRKIPGKDHLSPGNCIFNAFNTTPFDKVKVVILGQDPYHGQGRLMDFVFRFLMAFHPAFTDQYLQRAS
jgi:uracil-DNA glycosylase